MELKYLLRALYEHTKNPITTRRWSR